MKKSERLNQELIYLSDKKIFHLKEIEDQFSISERTALRDITDLERLGLSFYTEAGRNGGYHITNNKLLMPIRFNTQEINAIFFALQAIKRISATPYSNEYDEIKQKLLKSLPDKLQEQVQLQTDVVHFNSQPSLNRVKYFEILIDACTNNKLVCVRSSQLINKDQELQLLDLFFQAGNWFCHAYNEKSASWYVLRLDKFERVEIVANQHNLLNKAELLAKFKQYEKEYYQISYRCILTKAGEQKIQYNSYPIMNIMHDNGKIYLDGKYSKKELHYLVDYLISLGNNVKILYPVELKRKYLAQLREIMKQYD